MTARKQKIRLALFILLSSAFAARIVFGVLYFNSYDTYWYRSWAVSLQEGLFNIYTRAEEISLDYPPVYLFFLYITGLCYRVVGQDAANFVQMFLMKFWPVLFDTACIFAVWLFGKKYGETAALFAAAVYAVNPSVIYNCSFWGQTDSVMAFLLLAAFFLADDRPVWACVLFAVAGLTKYQSLFFTPVFLLFLFKNHGVRKTLYGIAAAAGTVVVTFLPFMIAAREPLLFFRVYLGGADTYKYCTFNAYNIYALLGLNGVVDSTKMFGSIPYSAMNILALGAMILLVSLFVFKGRRQNIYVLAYLSAELIFMLCTRMHERYGIIVLPLVLMAYVSTRRRDFLYQFFALTVLTLLNQAVVLGLVHNRGAFYAPYMPLIIKTVSALGVIVMAAAIFSCVDYFMLKENNNGLFKAEVKNA